MRLAHRRARPVHRTARPRVAASYEAISALLVTLIATFTAAHLAPLNPVGGARQPDRAAARHDPDHRSASCRASTSSPAWRAWRARWRPAEADLRRRGCHAAVSPSGRGRPITRPVRCPSGRSGWACWSAPGPSRCCSAPRARAVLVAWRRAAGLRGDARDRARFGPGSAFSSPWPRGRCGQQPHAGSRAAPVPWYAAGHHPAGAGQRWASAACPPPSSATSCWAWIPASLLVVLISLVAGLLFGDLLVPPRRAL